MDIQEDCLASKDSSDFCVCAFSSKKRKLATRQWIMLVRELDGSSTEASGQFPVLLCTNASHLIEKIKNAASVSDGSSSCRLSAEISNLDLANGPGEYAH
jgi:hypothetical protein